MVQVNMQVTRCKSGRLVGFCTLILFGILYAIHSLCNKGKLYFM